MIVTPSQADRLKKNAILGPWEVRRDEYYERDTGAYSVTEEVTAGDNSLFGQSDDMTLIDYPGTLNLAAAAPDMAETIASMTVEWGVERDTGLSSPALKRWRQWFKTEDNARAAFKRHAELGNHPILIRHLVSEVEVIDVE